MAEKQSIHYLPHHCGPQECDCEPLCKGRAMDPITSNRENEVTCKTCLRALAANRARAEESRVKFKAELYDEVLALAKRLGYGNVTDALMALAGTRELPGANSP